MMVALKQKKTGVSKTTLYDTMGKTHTAHDKLNKKSAQMKVILSQMKWKGCLKQIATIFVWKIKQETGNVFILLSM